MGTHDMLDAAHMGAHALHMTGTDQQAPLFDAVTLKGANTLNLNGIEKGCRADMVILQARSSLEAIRLRPARLFVIRHGRVISRTSEVHASVETGSRKTQVDFCP